MSIAPHTHRIQIIYIFNYLDNGITLSTTSLHIDSVEISAIIQILKNRNNIEQAGVRALY